MGRAVILLVLFGLFAPALAAIEAENFEDCAELVERKPELESLRCYWMIARRTGKHREALLALDRLAARRGEDPRIDLYRATILGDLGDFGAAAAAARAASGCEAAAEWTCATYSYINLAWHRRREPEAARGILEAARRSALQADDPVLLARVDVGLGWRAITDQDYAAARGAFERALAALGPDGPFDARNSSLSGLGYQAWATSRRQEALGLYRRQALEARAAGDRFFEAEALYNALLVELENLAETDPQAFLPVVRIEEAIAAAERAGNDSSAGWLHLLLSRNGVSLDRQEAEIEQALALGRSAGEFELVISAWRLQALHLADAGRFEEAVAKFGESLDLSRSLGDAEQALFTLELRAELYFRLQDLPRARRDVAQALAELDRLLARQPLALDRAGVFTRFVGGPYVFAHALTEHGELDSALAVIERLRDRAVLAELAPEDSSESEKQADANREIGSLRRELFLATDPTDRGELRERLAELQRRLETDLEPSGDDARTAPTLARLQSALDDETAILSFQIPPRGDALGSPRAGAWLLVIWRGGAQVLRLAPAFELAPAVQAFRGLLQRDDTIERNAAARLGDWLLADALDELPPDVRQLVVVPDVPLNDLPFAALRITPELPPLGMRFTFTQVPSLGAWLRRATGPSPALPAQALVLADPEAPRTADRPLPANPVATSRGSLLDSLPGARQEAAALTRTFGHDAAVLLGPEASEAALKAANLAGVGLVYFAAHGEVDIEHPERSALLLSPGGGEDGRLRLREIAALRLDGAVVVLAACHSAEGRSFPAQGVFSMARAFLHAGASAVVGNVREVDDDSASLVMRELTAHLGRGAPVAEALAAAQRQAIADGLPPAAWASAVVIGDGRVHLEPAPTTTFSWLEILAAAALVTLAVAGLALQQRRLR